MLTHMKAQIAWGVLEPVEGDSEGAHDIIPNAMATKDGFTGAGGRACPAHTAGRLYGQTKALAGQDSVTENVQSLSQLQARCLSESLSVVLNRKIYGHLENPKIAEIRSVYSRCMHRGL